MSAQARRLWPKIARQLDELGVLIRADQVALALLCEALADYLMAREIIEAAAAEADGVRFVAVTDKGNVIQHPAVGVMTRAWDRVVKLCKEFGATPSARAAIHLPGKEPAADPLLDMIRKRYGSSSN